MATATDLTGHVALVTGASRGLGRGIALCLAEAGADVVVNHLDAPDEAEVTVEAIRALGRASTAVRADVSDEAEVRGLFEEVARLHGGRLDILVNNAGTAQPKDIFETSANDWDRLLAVNLRGPFLCAREAMGVLRQPGYGRIVNIGSVAGQRGALFGHVHYAASKSGLVGFTQTLARTGARLGINVNCVAPGMIRTELLERTHGPQQVAEFAASVPLGLGTPRDVGLAVAFLCGEGGRYITGATLDVNGGANFR